MRPRESVLRGSSDPTKDGDPYTKQPQPLLLRISPDQTGQILPARARMMAREVKFVTDSPLEEGRFELSVPAQGGPPESQARGNALPSRFAMRAQPRGTRSESQATATDRQ
jgi:hypothetical protein